MNNVKIRQIKKEEFEFISNFVFNNFKDTPYSDGSTEKLLIEEIRKSKNYIKELEIVATLNENIIGYILLSSFPTNKFKVLLLAPICVDKNLQKKGIGKALIEESIKVAKELNFKGIIVLGDPNFYHKFGFKTSSKYNIYASEKNLPPSEDYLMALELSKNSLSDISGEVDYSIYKSLL